MNKPPLLCVQNISCHRGDRELLSKLSFDVQAGEAMQIVGSNGTGKTTLLRTLTGFLPVFSGQVLWQGQSIRKIRTEYQQSLCYIGHKLGVKDELTVLENLKFHYRYHQFNINLFHEAITKLGLNDFQDVLCRELSQGQRQRLALAQLMITKTLLWILDEPFAALDAAGVSLVQTIIEQQVQRGGMVIFTSHRPLTLSHLAIQSVLLSESIA